MFKWSLPLTCMNFSLHQASLILLLLLTFYSHLHLLLSMAPLRINLLPRQLVEHVPLNWSKVVSKFLQFTNHHVGAEVTEKRPYWVLCSSEGMSQRKTCMCFQFSQPITGCPLLRSKFCPKVHTVLKKSVRYNKCPL